ncbi:MAG: DUF2252 domain-containing protein [Gemmataceae bacterium]|nr:DUF2252 domain-containing protein [Gemmataceae bacterium]
MRDPVEEFLSYNKPFRAANPARMRDKVAAMRAGPFPFFRGTFHLYARDVRDEAFGPLPGDGPELDLVGDIHAENYGTYKADDGLVHYDINDFDEAARGRFAFDIARLAASLFLASKRRKNPLAHALRNALAGIESYHEELRRLVEGKGAEADPAEGRPSGCATVDELVAAMASASRADFVKKRTDRHGDRRKLLRTDRILDLPEDRATQARRLVADYAKRLGLKKEAGFFDVEDVAERVAGIGSLGRLRYVALVAGKGSKDAANVLLDFKESLPSAWDTARGRTPAGSRAERVTGMMRASQGASNKYLGWAQDGETTFQVRQWGPHDEKVKVTEDRPKPGRLEEVARMQARILARVHARSAARAGAGAQPLAGLEDGEGFKQRVLSFALACADQACRDHKAFEKAAGDLAP